MFFCSKCLWSFTWICMGVANIFHPSLWHLELFVNSCSLISLYIPYTQALHTSGNIEFRVCDWLIRSIIGRVREYLFTTTSTQRLNIVETLIDKYLPPMHLCSGNHSCNSYTFGCLTTSLSTYIHQSYKYIENSIYVICLNKQRS